MDVRLGVGPRIEIGGNSALGDVAFDIENKTSVGDAVLLRPSSPWRVDGEGYMRKPSYSIKKDR